MRQLVYEVFHSTYQLPLNFWRMIKPCKVPKYYDHHWSLSLLTRIIALSAYFQDFSTHFRWRKLKNGHGQDISLNEAFPSQHSRDLLPSKSNLFWNLAPKTSVFKKIVQNNTTFQVQKTGADFITNQYLPCLSMHRPKLSRVKAKQSSLIVLDNSIRRRIT